MFKRILVAVDDSATSLMALNEAVKLAKDQSAKLRILHVVDLASSYMVAMPPFTVDDYNKMLQNAGDKLMIDLRNKLKSTKIDFDLKIESVKSARTRVSDVINKQAEEWPADLIVIGTHGRRGFDRIMLGSVAEAVARTCNSPVLLIRGKGEK
jgi:nucleotide-binding universal stress UspA family protein